MDNQLRLERAFPFPIPPHQRLRVPPVLAPAQLMLVPAFREELGAIAADSTKFAAFSRDLIIESAHILARYGISSVEASKQADKRARGYLFEDLRLRGNLTFPELRFLVALNQHLPPHSHGSTTKVQFAELDIPRALDTYAPSLKLLGGLFRPSQEMVNLIRKELAEAANKDPPFKPFILPELPAKPWMPDTADHNFAMTNWKAYTKGRKNTIASECSMQSFLLFRLRFLSAADLCQVWAPFVGLAPQLSHGSIVLNLAVTESIGVAMLCHQALVTKISEKARQRNYNADEFAHLLSSGQFEFRERANRDTATAAKGKEKTPGDPTVPKVPKAPQVPQQPTQRNQAQIPAPVAIPQRGRKRSFTGSITSSFPLEPPTEASSSEETTSYLSAPSLSDECSFGGYEPVF